MVELKLLLWYGGRLKVVVSMLCWETKSYCGGLEDVGTI